MLFLPIWGQFVGLLLGHEQKLLVNEDRWDRA